MFVCKNFFLFHGKVSSLGKVLLPILDGTSCQPIAAFEPHISSVPYVVVHLSYLLSHSTIEKLIVYKSTHFYLNNTRNFILLFINKKWFYFFPSSSGMHQSHHLVGCHVTDNNSFLISFFKYFALL